MMIIIIVSQLYEVLAPQSPAAVCASLRPVLSPPPRVSAQSHIPQHVKLFVTCGHVGRPEGGGKDMCANQQLH